MVEWTSPVVEIAAIDRELGRVIAVERAALGVLYNPVFGPAVPGALFICLLYEFYSVLVFHPRGNVTCRPRLQYAPLGCCSPLLGASISPDISAFCAMAQSARLRHHVVTMT